MIFDRFYGRNLQQQVMYLTWIAGQATDVVKSIVGRVDAAGGLPAASLYANGSTFAVGQEPPYTYYVAIDGMWVNIGVFPVAGSPGSPGENGRSVFVSSFSPSPASIGQSYHVPLSSFNGDPAVNDLVLLSGRWLSIVTALTPPYATVLIYADLQGAQGEPGEGIDTIEKMETPYTIDSITYSIEDGLKIYGHGRINGADTYEQVLTIPIRAGENIIIDASADNKELVISSKAATSDKWTEEEISLLESVFQNIAYTSESAGQTAADELIAALRAGAKVTGITATAVSKTRYVGDSLTVADFNVYALYSDGTRQLVTSGYTVSPEVITATSFTATVTYKAFTASVPMTAEENVATSIEVVSYTPTKTLYIGDAIATSGYFTYVITFARGNSQTMTAWAPITVSPTTITGESTETTVSYGSLSAAYTISGAKAKPVPTMLSVAYTGSTSVGTVVTADNWSYTVKDQYGQNMDVTGSLQCVPSGNALVEGNNTFGLSLFLESATLRTEAVVVGVPIVSISYTITYDSTVDGEQTVTFTPMPTEVDDGASTTIQMQANATTASYYAEATGIAINEVRKSSVKVGATKTEGTGTLTISNQKADATVTAVPTLFFHSTNQAYTDGTAYAPAYNGNVSTCPSGLYELKDGKHYIYTDGGSGKKFRVAFVRADYTAMGGSAEQQSGTVIKIGGANSDIEVPANAKYFFVRYGSIDKNPDVVRTALTNAYMLLECE